MYKAEYFAKTLSEKDFRVKEGRKTKKRKLLFKKSGFKYIEKK